MALTNQPYLPLYVQDWLSNNKLKLCSIGAHGLMINIMCVLHKEKNYGKILLKQRYKQNPSKVENFACMFAKLLPFELADIKDLLSELIEEEILLLEGEENVYLVCNRMVEDAELSDIRAKAGKKGGKAKPKQNPSKTLSKTQASTEYETEYENSNEYSFEKFWNLYDKKIGKKSKVKIKWDKLSKKIQKEIIQYIPLYIQSQPEKQYRKHPETFLNNESWNDEIINRNASGEKKIKPSGLTVEQRDKLFT